jgi:protein-S-isoprenylcysteine O-methyltransferase Ste14
MVAEHARIPLAWGMLVAALGTIAVSSAPWPHNSWLHELIEHGGLLLMSGCIAGRLWCMLYIGGRKNQALVRNGPYSVTRNPLYLFAIAGVAGIGFAAGSLTLGIALAGGYFLLLRQAVLAEETRLLAAFGEKYAAYLREVPRWVPAPELWRDGGGTRPRPALVRRTLLEGTGLLLVFAAIEGLESLQELGLLPVHLVLP